MWVNRLLARKVQHVGNPTTSEEGTTCGLTDY